MADCARNALAVVREKGCRKMVWLGTDGVGSSRASAPWFFNWIGKLAATLFYSTVTKLDRGLFGSRIATRTTEPSVNFAPRRLG